MGRAGVDLFIEDGAYTTLSSAVVILVVLTLLFSSTAAIWSMSRAGDTQVAADSGALAGANVVSSYHTAATVVDASILSLGLAGFATIGTGLVAILIPGAEPVAGNMVDTGIEIIKTRNKFAKSASEGLQKIETALPYLIAARATQAVSAQDTDSVAYTGTALAVPRTSESDFVALEGSEISTDAIKDASEDLERAAEELESPAWVQEMVQCPTYAEGELEYEVLRRVGKAACDEVAEGRRQTDDYRDYIESWVHEAKLPLAAAHLILENLDGSEDDLSRVDDLGRELARVERYIDQALYYARSEVVERDYLIRRWDLKTLVTGAIKANARELIAAHVAPVCENLDFEVFTDEKWLEFILGQLIQNSIKYAREDGAKIVFSGALLDEGLASERIELTVADNGCGVSAADLPRVFEKGFTGDNGRTTKRATGIGLYLVARLCSKMGIDVTAASEPGEGFTVTFAFSTNKFQYFE